jgi:formylglycine-generating enzyme required for sulfatase activity
MKLARALLALGVALASSGCASIMLPRRQIEIAAFELDVTEVTVGQYRGCVSEGGCTQDDVAHEAWCNWKKEGKENHPMNCVDWSQAKGYCEWAGKRLPTEEEWEVAARGREERAYPWGNKQPTDFTPMGVCWGREESCHVGSNVTDATPAGLMDMGGNVQEWTSSPTCDGSSCAGNYVARGSSWNSAERTHDGQNVLLLRRWPHEATDHLSELGFRCAR